MEGHNHELKASAHKSKTQPRKTSTTQLGTWKMGGGLQSTEYSLQVAGPSIIQTLRGKRSLGEWQSFLYKALSDSSVSKMCCGGDLILLQMGSMDDQVGPAKTLPLHEVY